ncbi:Hypothetical_protein [Hexamita inflata]|uniref:Hypothetical_protein n=1 Tax=Hexamita inflata TaxID=28002 RepID=A0AA86RC95_9EUKA|nr:Hypothetical protein HINF_LOCUS58102 [Hexamita inflata]
MSILERNQQFLSFNNAHNYLRTSVNGKEDKLAYLKAVWRNNEHMHSIFSVFETLTVSNGSVERLFSFYHRQTSHFLRRNLDNLTLDAMAYIYVEKLQITLITSTLMKIEQFE